METENKEKGVQFCQFCGKEAGGRCRFCGKIVCWDCMDNHILGKCLETGIYKQTLTDEPKSEFDYLELSKMLNLPIAKVDTMIRDNSNPAFLRAMKLQSFDDIQLLRYMRFKDRGAVEFLLYMRILELETRLEKLWEEKQALMQRVSKLDGGGV